MRWLDVYMKYYWDKLDSLEHKIDLLILNLKKTEESTVEELPGEHTNVCTEVLDKSEIIF